MRVHYLFAAAGVIALMSTPAMAQRGRSEPTQKPAPVTTPRDEQHEAAQARAHENGGKSAAAHADKVADKTEKATAKSAKTTKRVTKKTAKKADVAEDKASKTTAKSGKKADKIEDKRVPPKKPQR